MFDLAKQDIKYLPGVGPQRAKLLNDELQIFTYQDLLYTFPYKHIDRSRLYAVRELTTDMPYVQLKGRILSFETEGEGRKRRIVAHFTDGYGVVDLVWFNGLKYIISAYKVQTEYIVFGRPSAFNGRINIVHPDIEPADGLRLNTLGLRPYYTTTEKMKRKGVNSRTLENLTTALLQKIDFPIPETLPEYLVGELCLMSLDTALRTVHYPQKAEELKRAQYRLKFEELLYVQLGILRYAKERLKKYRGYVFSVVGDLFRTFYASRLPFELTAAQKRVIREIRHDMGSGRQMNRLLQGDVGSGKTLVALMSMLIALDNGFQACIVAPTEILAEQHYATFLKMLGDMPVRTELLTGTVKGRRRREVLEGLENGTVQILVGTHAVLEDNVVFRRLGMVVIDEQHRFGVAQRAKMWRKSIQPPHVLVMTATPIPRTLAMTVYGDLDVSVIDELPPGRKPVRTIHRFENKPAELYQLMQHEINAGRQVYVVYPLIKESEKIDIQNLEKGYEQLCRDFPHLRISRVHGKMKSIEKDEEMQRFASGETQILVATTVIEVGVNVPNATVMVIENAERFGLAQLHQLRGRVGRGGDQSYCILVTKYQLAADTRKRMQIMTETNDGFEIAEADMKLRGPGDLEGTQQSGVAFDLKIADIVRDGQILQMARIIAERILEDDPHCAKIDNEILWKRLRQIQQKNVNWSSIS